MTLPSFTPLPPSSLALVPSRPCAATGPSTADAPAGLSAAHEAALQREEQLLQAFGTALQICVTRRGTDLLDAVLGAQQVHLEDVIHAMSEQHRGYGELLERAVAKLGEALSSDTVLGVGEVFRLSAGEIEGAMRRNEHLTGKILVALKTLNENVESLATLIAGALKEKSTEPSTPHTETSNLRVLPTCTGDRKRAANILEQLGDDNDEGEVT